MVRSGSFELLLLLLHDDFHIAVYDGIISFVLIHGLLINSIVKIISSYFFSDKEQWAKISNFDTLTLILR